MKTRLKIILSLLIILLPFDVSAAAVDNSSSYLDSAIIEVKGEAKSQIISNINLCLLSNGSQGRLIECFDVSENGWFAIGFSTKTIHVFDENGEFQYGYKFKCDGDYGISFYGNNLALYFVRGNVVAIYDSNGNCVKVLEYQSTIHINEQVIYKTSKKVDETTYWLERDVGLFARPYSRLVSENAQGVTTVLYDVTTLGYIAGIGQYALIIGFVVILVSVIIVKVKES